jgi:hypothetical protein
MWGRQLFALPWLSHGQGPALATCTQLRKTENWLPAVFTRISIVLSYMLLSKIIVYCAIVIRDLIFKDATRCDYTAVDEHVTVYRAVTGLMAGL